MKTSIEILEYENLSNLVETNAHSRIARYIDATVPVLKHRVCRCIFKVGLGTIFHTYITKHNAIEIEKNIYRCLKSEIKTVFKGIRIFENRCQNR